MDLSSVRIREHYGLVSNDTHTGQFSFLVSPPKNRASMEKGDYVLLDHSLLGEACQILAIIKEITSYEEVAGSTIGDKMGKMLATAEMVGYIDLRSEIRPLNKVLVPPNAGSRIYVPLTKFLEDIFKRNAQGKSFSEPIEVGIFEASSAENLENSIIKCFIDAQELTSMHTLIASVAGAGKTHLAKIIIKEMAAKIRTPIVVFDNYGEYTNDLNVNAQMTVFNIKPKASAKKIDNKKIEEKNLSEKAEKDSLSKEIKLGKITILNTQSLTQEERREFYLDTLETLLELRIEDKVEPFFLIGEEAQNLKGEELNQIMSEGRKKGISLCLLCTHPTGLGSELLTQIGNQIIGKSTDKDDIEYLTNITGTSSNALSNLTVGEWIINGINAFGPMKIRTKKIEPKV